MERNSPRDKEEFVLVLILVSDNWIGTCQARSRTNHISVFAYASASPNDLVPSLMAPSFSTQLLELSAKGKGILLVSTIRRNTVILHD
jgi:hypothetical protein